MTIGHIPVLIFIARIIFTSSQENNYWNPQTIFPPELYDSVVNSTISNITKNIHTSMFYKGDIEISTWVPFEYKLVSPGYRNSSTNLSNSLPFCILYQDETKFLDGKEHLVIQHSSAQLIDSDLKSNYLLLLADNHEFWFFDIYDLENKTFQHKLLNNYDPTLNNFSLPNYSQIAFFQEKNYYFYVTELYMIVFSMDSAQTWVVDSFLPRSEISYVFEFKGYLFVGAGADGIDIYDISNITDIRIAFTLDNTFFNKNDINIRHFCINHTLIHDVMAESISTQYTINSHEILIEEKPNFYMKSSENLKRKLYYGDFIFAADHINGLLIVDITNFRVLGPVHIPIYFESIPQAHFVARIQDVIYVLGGDGPNQYLHEIFLLSFNLTEYGRENDHKLKSEDFFRINRKIKIEEVLDIFVDEKNLFLLTNDRDDIYLNGINSSFVPKFNDIRTKIPRSNIRSLQKIFANGMQYLLSIAERSIEIIEIYNAASYLSCEFSEEFLKFNNGKSLDYSIMIFTKYCSEKLFFNETHGFDSVCRFSYNLEFQINKSFFSSYFSTSSKAFTYAFAFGLIVAYIILSISIVYIVLINIKTRKYKKMYEQLKTNDSIIFDKTQNKSSIKRSKKFEANTKIQDNPKVSAEKHSEKNTTDLSFGVSNHPDEFNKDIYNQFMQNTLYFKQGVQKLSHLYC